MTTLPPSCFLVVSEEPYGGSRAFLRIFTTRTAAQEWAQESSKRANVDYHIYSLPIDSPSSLPIFVEDSGVDPVQACGVSQFP